MNTTALKRFATTARTTIKNGVVLKLMEMGFDANGNVPEDIFPQRIQGATLFRGQYYPEQMYDQWNNLYTRVQEKGLREVYEEVAYTWFNRIIAIRILQKNNLIQPVLRFVDGYTRLPQIVFDARRGRYPDISTSERMRLVEAMRDESKVVEQFSILLTAFCHANPILNNCFGRVADYTELLLPNDILADGGFIDMLNHTDYITDEDYRTTELLGWLYQFYISERKDEVFASFKDGKKAAAEDIPAATQIFTPNWIVKYMVQNTIGRIYLDNEPYSDLKSEMPYLVDIEPTPKEHQFRYADLSELTMIDPACGSGHILLEGFDLLLKMYREAGYTVSQAIEAIFTKNLIGVELDTRAKQLSMFALLLKASQQDSSFADAHVLPRVLDMPIADVYTWRDLNGHMICAYDLTMPENANTELDAAFSLLKQADNLGSIMQFRISPSTHRFMEEALKHYEEDAHYTTHFATLMHGFRLILALTDKYAAVVANPPYMVSGNMNKGLSEYVQRNFPEGKADMFSVFMILAVDMLKDTGKYGMINMQSWMFLSSFESLRHTLLDNYHIDSLLHLGPHTFDELSGEVVQNVAYVISKSQRLERGFYYRLISGNNCASKENLFLNAKNESNILFSDVEQANFNRIPGRVIGYWLGTKYIEAFSNASIDSVSEPRAGVMTGNDTLFTRLFFECSKHSIAVDMHNAEQAMRSDYRWFLVTRGGGFRKWYGNYDLVNDLYKGGIHISNSGGNFRLREPKYYFREGVTWNMISSTMPSFRYVPEGILFGNSAPVLFPNQGEDVNYILGFLNTKIAYTYFNLINPTINVTKSDVGSLPYIHKDGIVSEIVKDCVKISKEDWDTHETSWDFEANPIVALRNLFLAEGDLKSSFELPLLINEFKRRWEDRFAQLHVNEEELNRQFIDIYGLQSELTPEVSLEDITILQQGEISIEANQLIWHDEVLMRQLISYIVGIVMGRYRLDKTGLHIAHPEPTADELAPYTYAGKTVAIDEDAILPILPDDSPFSDNLATRVKDFIRIVFGEEHLTANLNYIEQALGKSINDYLQRDFFADHKKTYQNRPIYWLFASKKGAFRCLTYMHRMDAYTAEKVRSRYLLPYMDALRTKIDHLRENDDLTSVQRRELTNLTKAYEECREYHDRLHTIAGQLIAFDLDDGVLVNYAKFGDVLAKLK